MHLLLNRINSRIFIQRKLPIMCVGVEAAHNPGKNLAADLYGNRETALTALPAISGIYCPKKGNT